MILITLSVPITVSFNMNRWFLMWTPSNNLALKRRINPHKEMKMPLLLTMTTMKKSLMT
jgi:hypothetical protein